MMLAGGTCEEAFCTFDNCGCLSDGVKFPDDVPEETTFFCALPNQEGKPCLKLKPPGGNLSSSVALTVSELKDPVV